MTSFALSTFALSFILLTATGTSLAADDKQPAKPLPSAQKLSSGTMKLSKSALPKAPAVPAALSRSGDIALYDPVTSALDKWKRASAAYGTAGIAYRNKKDTECPSKEYTTSDQSAAGCAGSDSVAACSAKLYQRCWAPAYAEWGATQRAFFDARINLDSALSAYMTQVGVPRAAQR